MKTLYSYFAQILEDKQQVKQNSLQSDNLLKSNKKMRTIELTLSGICNVYWVESILDMNRVDTEKLCLNWSRTVLLIWILFRKSP